MRLLGRIVGVLVVLIVIGVAAYAALAWHSALPARPQTAQSFPPEQVKAGAHLADAANCTACHTRPNGAAYAGGLPIDTGFGTIYSTNITPDRDTGIGKWSEAAFARALREGVGRIGHDFYPAFPYDHFTHMRDQDIAAIYAFLMTRAPVRQKNQRDNLNFPFGFRPLLVGWKLLYLHKGPVATDDSKSKEWNRGAYLVNALAHCGSCHTPRNGLGAEETSKTFAGGDAEGWWAPPLNANSPALVKWDAESLYNYLRSWDAEHGGAAGPMAEVTASLRRLPDSDVHAIAAYVASFSANAPDPKSRFEAVAKREASGDAAIDRGHAIFEGACAQCHESNGRVPFTTASLAQHTDVQAPDPRNLLHVLMSGIAAPEGTSGAIMPSFAPSLTDDQVSDLLAYVRKRYSDQPAWKDVGRWISEARRKDQPSPSALTQ